MKPQQSATEQVAAVIKWALILGAVGFVIQIFSIHPPDSEENQSTTNVQSQPANAITPHDLTVLAVERDRAIDKSTELKSNLASVCKELNAPSFKDPAIASNCRSVGVESAIDFPPGDTSAKETNYNPNRVNTMSAVACGQAERIKNNSPQTVEDCRAFGVDLNNGDEFGEGAN